MPMARKRTATATALTQMTASSSIDRVTAKPTQKRRRRRRKTTKVAVTTHDQPPATKDKASYDAHTHESGRAAPFRGGGLSGGSSLQIRPPLAGSQRGL